MSDYSASLLCLMGIQSLVALSAYLLLITGQLSFGQQAYFGIGAYTGGAFTAMFGFDLASAMILGVVISALVGAGVGALTFRLGGLYFAIATLAFSELVRLTWVNLNFQIDVNGVLVGPKGPEGFRDIRYVIDNSISVPDFLWIISLTVLFVLVLFAFVERSRAGLSLRMLENDEDAATSLGVDALRTRIYAAAAAAALAGLGGVLFAHFMTFIDPANFSVMLGVHSLSYAMIGGVGTFFGPLIGVAIDIGLLESLRIFSGYRMIVFGSLVATILIFRPRGILDEAAVNRISSFCRQLAGREPSALRKVNHGRR